MTANALHRSFAGGEITPELHGRLDLTKHQTGAALIRNAVVLPHGPVQRRPGLRYVNEARDSSRRVRLIPFSFSADQNLVLEFGHGYIRFIVNGQMLLEPGQAVVAVDGNAVTLLLPPGWGPGDDIVFAGGVWRVAAAPTSTRFELVDQWGRSPTFTPAALTSQAARVYVLGPTPYTESVLFELTYAQDNDVLTIAHQSIPSHELRRLGPASWSLTPITFAPALPAPTTLGVVPTIGTATNLSPQAYVVTAVGPDGISESLESPQASTSNNLSLAGNFNTLTWSAVAGAAAYNVYKRRGGAFGYIGQTDALSIVDDNVLPDTSRTPPSSFITLNDAPGNYPAAVTYYEQRRWFAGTASRPQGVWATRSGTDNNLTSSVPTQDDDAFAFRLRSRKQNAIRHLVPLSDLLALSAGGEFRIYSESAPNITLPTLSTKPQGYSGSTFVQPVLTSGSVLYVQARGAHVREMAYNWQNNTFASLDLSLFAPHLFDGRTLVDASYAQAKLSILWAPRDDGVLLGMTYVPEHQVYAWHQHDTDGVIESVCTIGEGNEDSTYCVVRRTIDSRTVRYIERIVPQPGNQPVAEAFFVDAGSTYRGTPTRVLTNLWHLEGKEVAVLADGGVHPTRVVRSGRIELDAPAAIVHVGLPFRTQLKTLPVVFESAPAAGRGMTKNVNAVLVRVARTNVVKAGPSFDALVAYPDRDVLDLFEPPPPLRTEELRFDISPDWNVDGAVCFEQDLPLPLTILSVALDVAPGG